MFDLAFTPDRAAGVPSYRQLADTLRGLIDARRIGPGVKLPSTRELAALLAIHRNTANQAYQKLLVSASARPTSRGFSARGASSSCT